jgi:hypothetical protein
MKKALLHIILLFAVFSVSAQSPGVSAQPNTAEIKWDSLVINYGTIMQDSERNRELKFTNAGKIPLVITSCRSSCGCLVARCPTTPVAPGATGVIKVTYDTHRIGPFTKSITITANTSLPDHIIYVKGLVLDPNLPESK